MTVQATETQQPLITRIENHIIAVMNRLPADLSLGRALKDAIDEVVARNWAEAARQGWEPHEIEGLRQLTCATGANLARDLVSEGRMTADEFLNS